MKPEPRCVRCKEPFTANRPAVEDPESPIPRSLHADCLRKQQAERDARQFGWSQALR
jgi:hypothetical protein